MYARASISLIATACFVSACVQEPPVDGVRTEVTTRTGWDSAWVTVKWSPRDTGLVFPWRNIEFGPDTVEPTLADTTSETEIVLELNLDGVGQSHVNTGVGFFDHMLELLAKHAVIDLSVTAQGE